MQPDAHYLRRGTASSSTAEGENEDGGPKEDVSKVITLYGTS